jgi:hypothetical protein
MAKSRIISSEFGASRMSVTFTVGYSRPMIGVVSKYGKWSREPEYFKGVGHEGHDVGIPLFDVPFEVLLVAEGMLLVD